MRTVSVCGVAFVGERRARRHNPTSLSTSCPLLHLISLPLPTPQTTIKHLSFHSSADDSLSLPLIPYPLFSPSLLFFSSMEASLLMRSSCCSSAIGFLDHRRELSNSKFICTLLPSSSSKPSVSVRCSLQPSKPRSGTSPVHAVMTLAGYE